MVAHWPAAIAECGARWSQSGIPTQTPSACSQFRGRPCNVPFHVLTAGYSGSALPPSFSFCAEDPAASQFQIFDAHSRAMMVWRHEAPVLIFLDSF